MTAGLNAETRIGALQLKRYFCSRGATAAGICGQAMTSRAVFVSSSNSLMMPM
jgi:hypothetical protein